MTGPSEAWAIGNCSNLDLTCLANQRCAFGVIIKLVLPSGMSGPSLVGRTKKSKRPKSYPATEVSYQLGEHVRITDQVGRKR